MPGFGQLRLILIVAIVALQSLEVSEVYGSLVDSLLWVVPASLIPMLFALGGFWFAHESGTASGRIFASHRARRLLPVLLLSIILAALVLGPIFTTDALPGYVSDPDFGGYFLNLLGWPHARLPGVFEFNNAAGIVNAPYWVLPYLLAACVIGTALSVLRARTALLMASALMLMAAALLNRFGFFEDVTLPMAIVQILGGRGLVTLLCFLFGGLAYTMRDRVPADWRLLLLCAAVVAGIAVRGNRAWIYDPLVDIALAGVLSYAAVFLAASRSDNPRLATLEHYWLGLFFYSFPIQQAWMALGSNQQHWAVNLLLSLPVALLLAALSWHFLEKRALAPGQRAAWQAGQPAPSRPARKKGLRGLIPAFRPLPLYRARLNEILPGLALAIILFAVAAGIMAMTMFALQRDTPGM